MRSLTVAEGNVIETAGTAFAVVILLVARLVADTLVNLILIVVAWISLWYFPHCLVHYLVGRLGGIKFTHYVIGRSALIKLQIPYVTRVLKYLPVLGIRTDRESLQRSSPMFRRLMFQSGAYASMLLPVLTVAHSVAYASSATSAVLLTLTIGNVLLTLYYSPRAGDIWRAKISYPQTL